MNQNAAKHLVALAVYLGAAVILVLLFVYVLGQGY